jgi:AraC-like DNA-binding protein
MSVRPWKSRPRNVKKIDSKTTQNLRRLVREIPEPASLFSGLTIQQSLAPENIIFFQRTDTTLLKPEGVSVNFHHRFELVTVLDTAAPARIDRVTYDLHPGECALIFPNQFHHFMDVERTSLDWLFITFELKNPEAIRALHNSPRMLDAAGLDLLQALIREFVQPQTGTRDTLEISYVLSRLLLHLRNCEHLPPDRRDIHSSDDVRDVILESINKYVRANLGRAVTIANIAEELGYSVSHLRAVFRDRLGVSLGKYMRESRLSEAAQLLLKSDLNVSEIGERCGFESLYAFSRAFRKAYGIPPRTYRQLVQEGGTLPVSGKK